MSFKGVFRQYPFGSTSKRVIREPHLYTKYIRLCHIYYIIHILQKKAIGCFTYCNTKEVGFIHDVQHHFPHFAVIHSEVMEGVLPMFYPEQLHHAS